MLPVGTLLLLALVAASRGVPPDRIVSVAAVGDLQLSVAVRNAHDLPGGDPFAAVVG